MGLEDLPRMEFAFPGPLRDQLVAAVLSGAKTTTTGLVAGYESAGEPLPQVGDRLVVVDSAGLPVATIELTDVRVVRLADVDLRHVVDEGEGDESVAQWRAGHEQFWHSEEARAELGDPGFTVDDDTPVLTQRFRLVSLENGRAATAALVVRFYEQLWNRWDDAAVDEVLAEGFRFRGSLGNQTIGRDGWRGYRDLTRRYAPDFHNEIVTLVTDQDRAAARLTYTGTHLGPVLGFAPTGRRFSYSGAAFFTASDGLLSDAWVLGDLDTLRSFLAGDGPT